MVATLSAAKGTVLIPERSGALHAFGVADHDTHWTFDLEGELWATPLIWNDMVYAVSWGRRLHCLSLAGGDELWARDLPAAVTASPALAAGALYLGTESGELLAFDARSGQALFRDRVGSGPIQASPLPFGDVVLIAALDGTVAAYS